MLELGIYNDFTIRISRMIFEIVMMVIFRFVKFSERQNFGDDRFAIFI